MKKSLRVFAYLFSWMTASILLAFIIDIGFIQVGLIESGSSAERLVYVLSAIACLLGGFSLFEEVFSK